MKIALIVLAVLLVPVVPFILLGTYLEPWLEEFLQSPFLQERPVFVFGIVIFVLAIDILLPVPSSVVGTLAGQVLGVTAGCMATWIGLNVSCWIGFLLARRFGARLVSRFASDRALIDVEQLVHRWGIGVLIGCRALPVLAEASVLLAGLGRMNHLRFWPAVVAGNFGLAISLAALGDLSARQGWIGSALAISVAVPVTLLVVWIFTRPEEQIEFESRGSKNTSDDDN